MPDLEELVRETQKVMARNLSKELYGPNALVSFLGYSVPKKSFVERTQLGVGEFFLKIANKLGAYNED